MNQDAYITHGSPGAADIGHINDAFKQETEAFEETENLLTRLEGEYAPVTLNAALPLLTKLQSDLDALTPYLGGLEGKNYKFDEGGDINKFPGGPKKVNAILNTGRTAGTPADLANVKILAKKALYGTEVITGTANNYNKYYKEKIDNLVLLISELKL